MNSFPKKWRQKQALGIEHLIMDRYCVEARSAERSAKEAKSAKIVAWISACAAIVAAIAAVIALFKS